MSDKVPATGDTSASLLLRAPPAVAMNPLLSAAVTNLTLDDFAHNAMLLPAASPFVPVAPLPVATPSSGPHADAPSHPPSVVFAGPGSTATSGIPLNTDTFSEISLDYDDSAAATQPAQSATPYVSTGGHSATIAALNQLPIVASTVFSSFSNIISHITNDSGPSPHPQVNSSVAVQPEHHPAAASYQAPNPAQPAALFQPQPPPTVAGIGSPFYQQPPSEFVAQPSAPLAAAPLAAPPRLYSPHDAAVAAEPIRPPSQPPPSAGNANTYRLNQKRKIYAPLPGLNTTAAGIIAGNPVEVPPQGAQAGYYPPTEYGQQYETPAAHPPAQQSQSFSLSALIHKVPLLEKLQQLTVASPTNEPSSYSSGGNYDPSSQGLNVVASTPSVYNPPPAPQPFVSQQFEAPQLFNPGAPAQVTPSSAPFYNNPAADQPTLSYSSPAPQQFAPSAPSLPAVASQTPPLRKTSTPAADPSSSFFQPSQQAAAFSPAPPLQSAPAAPFGQSFGPPPIPAAHLPPAGVATSASGYRLKGKPLYKTPNTYGTVAAPALFQPVVAQSDAQSLPPQVYNPLQSTGVPTTNAYVAAPQLPLSGASGGPGLFPPTPPVLAPTHQTPAATEGNAVSQPPTQVYNPQQSVAASQLPPTVSGAPNFFQPPSQGSSVQTSTLFAPSPPTAAASEDNTANRPPTNAYVAQSFFQPPPQGSAVSEVIASNSASQRSTPAPVTLFQPFATQQDTHTLPPTLFQPQGSSVQFDSSAAASNSASQRSTPAPSALFQPFAAQQDAQPLPPTLFQPQESFQQSNTLFASSPPTAAASEAAITSNSASQRSTPAPVALFQPFTTQQDAHTFPQSQVYNPQQSTGVPATNPQTFFQPPAAQDSLAEPSKVFALEDNASNSAAPVVELNPIAALVSNEQRSAVDGVDTVAPIQHATAPAQFFDSVPSTAPVSLFTPLATSDLNAAATASDAANQLQETVQNQDHLSDNYTNNSENNPPAVGFFNPETASNSANFFNPNPTQTLSNSTSDFFNSVTPQAASDFPIQSFFNANTSAQQTPAIFNPFQAAPPSQPPPQTSAPLVEPAAPQPETPFDNYINLQQQTVSSFIASPDIAAEPQVPSVDLPDLVAPVRETAEPAVPDNTVDTNRNVVFAQQAVPQQQTTNATTANPLASFFSAPAPNEPNANWFNPIPVLTATQPADNWPNTAAVPLHKPQPTDPINFFNQTTATSTAAPVAPTSLLSSSPPPPPPTASSLDIVNNSTQIANFFNNPPPLPDDATQQQLDLVKDCNRNYQAQNVDNVSNGESLPPVVQLHRRVEEVAQHFDPFGSGCSAVGSIDTTQSFASSNIVEPPSSIQSELSEYAGTSASLAGGQQKPVEEEDTEVQRFLAPEASAANTFIDPLDAFQLGDQTAVDGMATPTGNIAYRPVCPHWFYNKASALTDGTASAAEATTTAPPTLDAQTPGSETSQPATPSNTAAAAVLKSHWTPFSTIDSQRLHQALDAGTTVCTTNGGRFDVNLPLRRREPVYWQAPADEVRRCSWFYKGPDSRLVPYDEDLAALLEAEYRQAAELGKWSRKIALPGGDTVVLHGPNVMVQFSKSQTPDSWTENAAAPVANRPRIVKRGLDEFVIEEGESEQVDHLMFMVHGIGAACDLKFRTVEQVVEEFRTTAHQLVQSHYRHAIDQGRVGRIEVLPISWHAELHSEETGIDEKLRAITLESIPKLRTFTNSTLLDILFYTSPVFCQQIIDAVAGSINRKYQLYCQRNPRFGGDVSLAGHSLGSVIVFDLLQNQRAGGEDTEVAVATKVAECTVGQAGTGQQSIMYPQLVFKPRIFFAFGSPIGMFVTVRGIHTLGLDYKLPTCAGFYNIFHPYDPVAYRIEALINADLAGRRPVLIPHHKGRKRMHLELRETIQRVGNDIKQRVVETFRSTMNRVYNLSPITLQKNIEHPDLQLEVDEVLEREKQLALDAVESVTSSRSSTSGDIDESSGALLGLADGDQALGRLNGGRRVDYVLQEAPLEFFNEYLFALTSHVCYWESADTTLFIAKEIYASMGILTDHKQPQQTAMLVPPSDS